MSTINKRSTSERIHQQKKRKEAKIAKQKTLKQEIETLVAEYNSKQERLDPNSRILILDSHDRLCRCMTCWHTYGSDKRNEAYEKEHGETATNSVYSDIYNSNTRFYRD